MSEDWDYSKQSHLAKKAGGPEKYADLLREEGREEGRKEMIPYMIAVVAVTSGIHFIGSRVIRHLKSKKEQKDRQCDFARENLINGINEYNKDHPSENNTATERNKAVTENPDEKFYKKQFR